VVNKTQWVNVQGKRLQFMYVIYCFFLSAECFYYDLCNIRLEGLS